jgi:OmpA-OmpF porin, OOP family
MINRCLLGAGVALGIALGGVQAHAQLFGPLPPGAFYLGPEGGWTSLGDQTNRFTATTPRGVTSVIQRRSTFNSGFNAGVRGGYMMGPLRIEEEYSYRYNSLQSFAGAGDAIVKGSDRTNSIMTNVIYDFTYAPFGWPITPHLGIGIGAVNLNSGVTTLGTRVPANLFSIAPNGFSLNGNSWAFGYQPIAGIRYLINPALAFDLDYRYLATTNFTFTNRNVASPTSGRCCGAVSVRTGYNTQNLVASLTMLFGAPPAAPPPAPPAPPPPPTHQVYLVFFDWDKYNITPEGMQILEAAAAHWRAGGAVQIQVTGYTDLSGSAGYNQRLSERRANAVATVLQRLGVPREQMIVAGRGMNDPRVPTPLGVREPQNRRVEIVFP